MADDVAYQNAAQVRQLLNERELAVAYGQTTRVEAVDKQLAELGYTPPDKADKADKAEKGPKGRGGRPKSTTEG